MVTSPAQMDDHKNESGKDFGESSISMDYTSSTCRFANYDPISPWALDIGGSLIKLVYFSREDSCLESHAGKSVAAENNSALNGCKSYPILNGKLHFAKFETTKMNECLDFIESKQILGCRHQEVSGSKTLTIKATGGGAYKFANLFQEKFGVRLEKEDEMDCLVAGVNFLLKVRKLKKASSDGKFVGVYLSETSGSPFISIPVKSLVSVLNNTLGAVPHEAFTYLDGRKEFMQIDPSDMFPYLLVNIGSGVSMIKVDGDGKFERVSGTSIGGGTFWGLGRLLTKCQSFDELLELSHRGNNRVVDMLVGDIYGGLDYSKIGLSATAIASSFGKAISDKKDLEDYKPEDVARSLLRLISNNIGQIAYLNALLYGLKRIIFGGFFIRGHEYTMDTISVAVQFWSKGEAKAMFLRHEGFLGALGALKSYEKHGFGGLMADHLAEQSPILSPRPLSDQKVKSPFIGELTDNESIDCSVLSSETLKAT